MPEIDPVIFEFKARVDGYLASVKRTTDAVDRSVGLQEKRIQSLEREMKRASGSISGSLRGLAGTLATYFTGRELAGLVDGFTRVQNALRVAGLEGDRLAAVQSRLLEIGSRYGVSLESLADLYGKSAQSAQELGASEGQLLSLSGATAQALKISGTNAQAASGAILGLSQALAGGTVRAEEFNQINEGGLRPLLQAAAASERWGGSVAKLRKEVNDGKVSSQDFFRAILAGSDQLESQAAKSTLTLAGAFQTLSDRVMVYVGEAATANGATAAVSQGMLALANNLNTVINALAVIGVAMAGRYVAGMVAARGATLATGTAVFALQARMIGAATTAEALAFAGAGAGRALLAAFGGPVGIAITAIALAIGYAVTRTEELTEAQRQSELASRRQAAATETASAATEQLANAEGKARAALLASMQASRARAAQALQTAKAQIVEARAALEVARANAQKQVIEGTRSVRAAGGGIDPGITAIGRRDRIINPVEEKLKAAEDAFADALGRLQGLDEAIKAAKAPVNLGGAPDGKNARPAAKTSDASDRQEESLSRLSLEELRARADLTTNLEDRAELERQILEEERAARVREINAQEGLTRDQRAAQISALDRLYGGPNPNDLQTGEIIAEPHSGLYLQQLSRQIAAEQAAMAVSALEAQQATLAAQADIETDLAKRHELERKALDVQHQIDRARLEESITAGKISESAREELKAQQAIAKRKLDESQRSPGEAYREEIRKNVANINEGIEAIEVEGLKSLNDGIVEAIMGTRSLGDVFKSVANQIVADLLRIAVQRALIEPLSDALFGGGSGGGGGGSGGGLFSNVSSLFSSIFGHAGGGSVRGGQLIRVNEGSSPGRVEGFIPSGSGEIVPLGRMNAAAAGMQAGGEPVVIRLQVVEGQMFEATVDQIATARGVQIYRETLPHTVDTAAKETFRRASRPRI